MTRFWATIWLLASFLTVAASGVAQESDYEVGISKVDITPDYPIRLNGFGFRRNESEGVAQRIWAKALAISQGNEPPLVLVTIDSLGIRLPMVEELAAKLNKRFGIPREQVALTFSHSHCTPKVNGASDNIFSQPIPPDHQAHIDRYTQQLGEWLEQAAASAIENRKPAKLSWAIGKVGFAVNRRTAGGPVDHDLPVMLVQDPDGKPRAIYFNYACHCVTLSFNRISGDWSGHAQESIEQKFPGAIALGSIGCGSDSNPSSGVTGDQVQTAAAQGAEIADEVVRLIENSMRPISGPISAKLELIDLPFDPLPSRDQLQQLAAQGGPAGYNATTQLARLERGESLPTALRYPVQSFSFGNHLHMVFLGGEVCADYALRLKRELQRDRLWLNAYSNDFGAYIPSERLVKEGGYGGGAEIPYFALPSTLQAGLEQKIIDAVHRQAPSSSAAPPGTHGVPPKSPEESMQSMRLHDNLKIALAASEPLVQDPVAIDFGADGRLWVVEMTDYARGVNEDFSPTGRVSCLTDTNQDGRFDEAATFLTGLRFPTDVKVWKKGVLVCDAPDILYAEDTNGDGQADVRKVLFTGFATHNPHGRVNSLRHGLDNWVYGSGGLFGGRITNAEGRTVDLGNRDFRMNPDSGVIEPVSGATQQGRPRDDWGNWFGCTNGTLLTHYVVDDHYARRNPAIAPPPVSHYPANYPNANRLFPLGDLVLFKLSGPPGVPTAACGLEIYRDTLLGDEFYGNSFTCEPVNQLIHRLILTREGATFTARRSDEEHDREFLASTDRWFRPVQVRTGPDGALWVVDMYRYLIEHPQWLPPESVAELDVFAGNKLGRIYRILPKDGSPHSVPRFDTMTNQQLVDSLDSANGIQRDLAHQLLVWRGATDVDAALERIMREARQPAARLQAAAILDGVGLLKSEAALRLLNDESPEVRRHGVRLCEQFLDKTPEVLTAFARLAEDTSTIVRIQLAYSLGESRDERATETLALVARGSASDVYVEGAVLSSLTSRNVVSVLRSLATQAEAGGVEKIREKALAFAASTVPPDSIGNLIDAIVNPDSKASLDSRWTTLAQVADAIARRNIGPQVELAPRTVRQLDRLLAEAINEVSRSDAPAERRKAAIEFVSRTPGNRIGNPRQLLASLIVPQENPEIQSLAIQALDRDGSDAAADLLLQAWDRALPRLRGEIADALLRRKSSSRAFIEAIRATKIRPHEIDAAQREKLLNQSDQDLRQLAASALESFQLGTRTEVVQQWQTAAMANGDAGHGRDVFRKLCAACHQLDGFGIQVGPDLAALTSKSPSSLLVAILDPNRDVDARYMSYVALGADGRTITGILVSETGNSITLREQGGKDHVLLRKDLEELRSTMKSAMPEGLEKDFKDETDLADLIAYLLEQRIPPKTLAGNTPEIAKPRGDGAITLDAAKAEIYGNDITFEANSPFKNIGYWHGANDYAGWRIDLPSASRFEVYLDYACAEDSAGNGFRLEGGEPLLRGIVTSTGAWSNYRLLRIGTVELPAGKNYLAFRYDGEPRKQALIDLRAIHLIPPGVARPVGFAPPQKVQDDLTPTALAAQLLDDTVPSERRQQLLAEHPENAAAVIREMAGSETLPSEEEYRRIPWIWRVAIAAGKRNTTEEIREVLDVSLPNGGQPLRDWQAVVIGGGIINGISLAGDWPKTRIEEALKVDGILVARWQRTVEAAAHMADNEKVPTGTRYDALRIIAMGPWALRGQQLEKYLKAGTNEELQMGAVSGVADMQSPEAAASLVKHVAQVTERNRELALDGLIRSPQRSLALLDAIAGGSVEKGWLGENRRKKLLENSDAQVRERAKMILR